MEKLQSKLKFIEKTEKLKSITRHNSTIDDRYENSAEHSW